MRLLLGLHGLQLQRDCVGLTLSSLDLVVILLQLLLLCLLLLLLESYVSLVSYLESRLYGEVLHVGVGKRLLDLCAWIAMLVSLKS